MSVCAYCGKENDPLAVFCVRCQRLLAVRDISNLPKTSMIGQNESPAPVAQPQPVVTHTPTHTAHRGRLGSGRVGLYIDKEFICIEITGKALFGRALATEKTDLTLDLTKYAAFEKGVSRIHCALAWDGANLTIEDLKSSNGTWINSVRLTPYKPHPIENGELVLLGKLDMWVYFR